VVVRIRKGRRLGKRGKEGPSQGRWRASQRDEGRSHSSERIIITFFFKKKILPSVDDDTSSHVLLR
jgi:hypothetical protein